MPVVVRANHGGNELVIIALSEELSAESGPRGEVEAREHPVDVHVADPLVDVVGTWTNLVEGCRVVAPLLGDPAGHRVQAERGDLDAVDQPGVGAVRTANDARRAILEFRRQMLLEELVHGRRLDDVIVHTHQDHVSNVHRHTFPGYLSARSARYSGQLVTPLRRSSSISLLV